MPGTSSALPSKDTTLPREPPLREKFGPEVPSLLVAARARSVEAIVEEGTSSVGTKYRRPVRSRGTFAAMRTPVHAIGRCAVVLLLLAGVGILGCGRLETPLTLVFTPSRDPTALKEAGDAFAKTLAELSGVPVRALVASDYAGVIEALRSKRVELAFVHPVGYVLANREAGCRILVRDVWGGKAAYTARLYVRKDRGLRRLEDLRGKTWPSWIPRRPRATSTRWCS